MAETESVEQLHIGLATPPPEVLLTPNIGVIGVGGAGGNAVNNMISSHLTGVSFFAANTDAQALSKSLCSEKIQLGIKTTQGLGAGAHPEIGRASAEESADKLREAITGLHLLFLTAGMGGGTGTGALPVIAKMAQEMNIMTVAVVSTPFMFEGPRRMKTAKSGIEELKKYVDTLIIVPNQNLFRVVTQDTAFVDAFKMADDVLCQGVRSITDLIMNPGIVNLDFADLTTVLKSMGRAMMGSGTASGENRATIAAEKALSNPLLDDVSIKGARSVLINISAGMDLTLAEADIINQRITAEVDPDANIISGTTLNQDLSGSIQVSVVATGLDNQAQQTISIQQPGTTLQQTLVTPPQNPISQPNLTDVASTQESQQQEEPHLIEPSPFDFVSVKPIAASDPEDLVVEGHAKSRQPADTLFPPDNPPVLDPVKEMPTDVESAPHIDLSTKTAESNVKPPRPDLSALVSRMLKSTTRSKQSEKKVSSTPLLDGKLPDLPDFLTK